MTKRIRFTWITNDLVIVTSGHKRSFLMKQNLVLRVRAYSTILHLGGFFFHTLVYSVSILDYSSEVFFSLLEKSSYIWIRPWSNSHWDERFLGVKTDKRTTSTDLLFGFSKYSYYDRQKIRNFVSTWQDRIYRQLIDTSWNSRISYKEKKNHPK